MVSKSLKLCLAIGALKQSCHGMVLANARYFPSVSMVIAARLFRTGGLTPLMMKGFVIIGYNI